ncbi:MAG TPA: response regulator [Smithellaceae bacterium]|nr:response regulator [Smithellaceae bacterium]HRS83056.1 response regulator [Smithellaceae bacterium]HRV45006.1 response regulator [Smithellaceae bacterium]
MSKILMIDDSGLSRRMMRQILEAGGHETIEASDGIAGLEQYFLEKPDLVMLDMTMAGMSGLEVLEKLRQMDPNAKVIVATADIQSSTRALVEAAGAKNMINKPLEKDAVLRAVADTLNETR